MFEQVMHAIARRLVTERAHAIEEACEAALQTGTHGVLIYRDRAGVEHIGPHPRVPYGQIYECQDGLPEGF